MKIETLKEIKKKYPEIRNVNIVHKKKLTSLEKLGLVVTNWVGTMGFFFIILIWTIIWMGWNFLAPKNLRFDPFPAFVLWLFISNLVQIHLMPLIMVGQNVQSKHADLRAEHDYETNKKAEKEIETVLLRLEEQNKLIQEMTEKIKKLEEKAL